MAITSERWRQVFQADLSDLVFPMFVPTDDRRRRGTVAICCVDELMS